MASQERSVDLDRPDPGTQSLYELPHTIGRRHVLEAHHQTYQSIPGRAQDPAQRIETGKPTQR